MKVESLPTLPPPSGNGICARQNIQEIAQKMVGMWSEIVLITPQMSAQWLLDNLANRHINEAIAQAIARDIKAGKFKLTHQGIAFKPDGTLADGQHRLRAVVIAGIPVRMMVTYNVPDDVMGVIDQTRKRQLKDTLKFTFGVTDGARAQAVMAIIGDAGRIWPRTAIGGSCVVTQSERETVFLRYRAAYDAIIPLLHVRRIKTPVQAALVFAYEFCPEKVTKFAISLNDGAGLAADSPILALRNMDGTKLCSRTLFTRALVAFYCYMRGRKMPKETNYEPALKFFGLAQER